MVSFDVIASDNVGVTSLSLTVGGTPVPLDDNGRGTYTASTLGQHWPSWRRPATPPATSARPTATLSVIDPTDTSAPTVSIAAPLQPGRDHLADRGRRAPSATATSCRGRSTKRR